MRSSNRPDTGPFDAFATEYLSVWKASGCPRSSTVQETFVASLSPESTVLETLQSLCDFFRRALQRNVPLNWFCNETKEILEVFRKRDAYDQKHQHASWFEPLSDHELLTGLLKQRANRLKPKKYDWRGIEILEYHEGPRPLTVEDVKAMEKKPDPSHS